MRDCGYASAAYAATGVEVETMTLPTISGYVLAESAATGGKSFKFLRNGVASTPVTTSARASRSRSARVAVSARAPRWRPSRSTARSGYVLAIGEHHCPSHGDDAMRP
jgi:hypothetical protein